MIQATYRNPITLKFKYLRVTHDRRRRGSVGHHELYLQLATLHGVEPHEQTTHRTYRIS